ncbi:L-asparaginase II [Aureobasidium pullulans]|nr:L-asparaginase II [Aureobasidium pullulans]
MDSHDLVLNWRGGVVENSHIVHAAIVDSDNNLLFSLGDPNRLTLARSAAKPFQALAILETGAAEKFNFDEADVALMCGSHNSENKHVSRVTAMLDKAGVSEENMNCGGHPALSKIINNGWIKNGFAPTAIYSNCSAKHVGMLAAAKSLDAGIENYHDPAHPVQAEIKRVHEDLSKLKPEEIYWVIDGCNAPSPALPLDSMALITRLQRNGNPPRDDRRRLQILHRSHARLLRTLIGKLGAEGCYGIGVRDCESTRRLGAKNGLGIAIKIEDGNIDMLYVALMEVLTRLNIGTEDVRESLKTTHCTMPKNTMGVVTGHTSFKMDLKKRN